MSKNCNWVGYVPSSGYKTKKVTIGCDENTSYLPRKGVIYITTDYSYDSITINQKGTPLLEISNSIFNISCLSQQISFDVFSNNSWQIQKNCDWVNLNPANGIDTAHIIVNITQNLNPTNRTCTLIIKDSYNNTKQVTINQDGFTFNLSLEPDTLYLKGFINSYDTIFIQSNTIWSIAGTFPEWLVANKLNGSGNDFIIFQALSENPYMWNRTCSLDIQSQAPLVKLVVSQREKTWDVDVIGNNKIEVLPNPTTGIVKFQSTSPIEKLIIYNSMGIMVKMMEPKQSEFSLDLSDIPKGLFYIQLTIDSQVSIHKVIVM